LYDVRLNAVNKLSEYKQVDVFGKCGIPLSYGEKYKLNTISSYKFSLCFENSVYPGYFTEKLLHAKMTGNIPLYYSDLTFSNDFNPKCCLNLQEIGLDNLYDTVIEIDQNEKLYREIYEQPLFDKKVSLEPIISQIQNTLNF
jgi:hypothetical protein